MATNIIGIIVTLIIFTPFVLIVVWAFRYQKRVFQRGWERMEDLLKRNQMSVRSLIPSDKRVMLKIEAEWKGKKFDIWNQYEGAGKSRTLFTYMTLHLQSRSLPPFNLYRENLFTKAGEKLGIKDVKTGDNEFDKFYRLNSEAEMDTQRFFDMNVVNRFMEEKKYFFGEIIASHGDLTLKIHSHPGHNSMWPHYEAMFRLLLLLAEKAG